MEHYQQEDVSGSDGHENINQVEGVCQSVWLTVIYSDILANPCGWPVNPCG